MNTSCGKEWPKKFLKNNFTQAFLNTKYKTHLEDVLYDQEKALMPATQPLVEEKVRQKRIRDEILQLRAVVRESKARIAHLERILRHPEAVVYAAEIGTGAAAADKKKFVRQCPANGCRGFLSSQWKCGLCEKWTCPDCHEVKGDHRDCAHTCDPNSVETAKMLEKDSKPCPKCQSLIFKIEGCDQMFCTQCHTAFSWRTGKLEHGNIHNPHYFEWQRQNGGGRMDRAPGDIQCGRELNQHTYYKIEQRAKKHSDLYKPVRRIHKYGREDIDGLYSTEVNALLNTIRQTIHNNAVNMARFSPQYTERNQNLRILYLEGAIDENTLKKRLQQSLKKHQCSTEIAQVLQLANTAITDIVYRIMDDLRTSENGKHNMSALMLELDRLRTYCNEILTEISSTYKTVQYDFDGTFNFENKANRTGAAAAAAVSMDDLAVELAALIDLA